MSNIQYYTFKDKGTGEVLFREATAVQISEALGVTPKLVSFWATVRCPHYIVTTKYDRTRKHRRKIRTKPMMLTLEEKVRKASELGISYGKMQEMEMIEERRKK